MSLELILIGISATVIAFLVSVRYFRLAYAKVDGHKLLSQSDKKIYLFWKHSKSLYRNTSRDLTDLIKDLPHLILHLLNIVFYKLYQSTKKMIDLIKGNKIKKDGGSVSIYLRKIEKKE